MIRHLPNRNCTNIKLFAIIAFDDDYSYRVIWRKSLLNVVRCVWNAMSKYISGAFDPEGYLIIGYWTLNIFLSTPASSVLAAQQSCQVENQLIKRKRFHCRFTKWWYPSKYWFNQFYWLNEWMNKMRGMGPDGVRWTDWKWISNVIYWWKCF